ncbi:hypothetical protein H257_06141 [Aphanomyces astaci]|uniref:Core-binding (CB) domain-containing protein n=1 Tax=Aphanomyces astaci TaxID=112090 RepID=W4GLT2_APHAT|nr:hypothetical protein H257_06141 [Aphanomyces astaci]ETV80617.1 hypothetical protein H257_06141 [Aphanomyces astaci]|eukprot:XP_009829564.1 hypothetical protein H257_06141 [Aphanomyces astaci]
MKQTIQDSFHGASTRRTYSTYQRQFEAFCAHHKNGLNPNAATPEDCTDFLHHLYSKGRKARTVDSAKTALVSFFKESSISPNPAQDMHAKRYVIGLQKYNRQNNVDDEQKAHPLTVREMSTLINLFANHNPFVASMFQLLLLRWHKKASVEKECQVYHLVDEVSYPCLRICTLYEGYLDKVRQTQVNVSQVACVFPSLSNQYDSVRVDWFKPLDQNYVRRLLQDLVHASPSLPIGISLHSVRRGGCFYKVFESPERKFNFRELMAWCRWTDAKTCCEYLVTRSISDGIDPRNMLRKVNSTGHGVVHAGIGTSGLTFDSIVEAVKKGMGIEQPKPVLPPARQRQLSLRECVVTKSIPTARSGRDAWDQWFTACPKSGLFCAIKDFTKDMIKCDRRKIHAQ